MLGMGGLGIPVSGHFNNRRRRVDELSPTQLSETNVTRRAAAREHLGPAGAALQLCSRGDRYGAGLPGVSVIVTGCTLCIHSLFISLARVSPITRITHLCLANLPGTPISCSNTLS